MYFEYISFENKNLIIYNDNLEIVEKHPIGECFIDFMETDFSYFEKFYNDISKIIKTKYSKLSNIDSTTKYIDKKNMIDFFKKYPKLRNTVINEALKSYKILYQNDIEIRYDLFYDIFNDLNRHISLIDYDIPVDLLLSYESIEFHIHDILTNVTRFSELTWKFVYEENCYIKNLDEIKSNLYIKLVEDNDSDESICTIPFHAIQQKYQNATSFCFNIDYNPKLNDLTSIQRYYLYSKLDYHNEIKYTTANTAFVNKEDTKYKYESYNQEKKIDFKKWSDDYISDSIISNIKSEETKISQIYETYKLGDIAFLEFFKMLENNFKIKKCKNCNKYFILKGDYATDYCDRIPRGEKFTCKKIAAINARKGKINKNPILKEYEKAYKRNHARLSSKKITSDEFYNWTNEASKQRDFIANKYEAKPNEQLVTDFKAYLGNK